MSMMDEDELDGLDLAALKARLRQAEKDRDLWHAELAAEIGDNEREVEFGSRVVSERDAARGRADQFVAVLHEIVVSLERDDPGRATGSVPLKSDRDVALSLAKSALAYDVKTGGDTVAGLRHQVDQLKVERDRLAARVAELEARQR